MNLFKTTFWNGIATVFRMLTGLVTTKIIAIFLGPQGVALLGNFNNIVSMVASFSNGAISNGIVKYIAEYSGNKAKQEKIVSNAIKINLVCSVTVALIIFIFYKPITLLIMKDLDYSYATVLLGGCVLCYGLNLSVSAILNGYRHMKYLVINNMISSCIMMILSIVITIRFGLFGAIINGMIAQVIIFIFNLYFIKRLNLINFKVFKDKVDKKLLLKLMKFSSMAIVTAICAPVATLIIRNYAINRFSVNEAGYIQGIWSISNSYLMVVTTTLSIYYLPTLASLKTNEQLHSEIIKGYKFILPLAILGGIGIYLFRDLAINLLYTNEFLPMRDYFLFQVLGDTFKIASFLLAYLLIAKAMTKWFIISEVFFCILKVIFSVTFMKYFGPIGETYAHALNYFIYLTFMIILFKDILLNDDVKPKKYS